MRQQKKSEPLSSLISLKSIKPKTVPLRTLVGLSVIFNTESLFHYFLSRAFRDYVDKCDNIFIDGAVLTLIANLFGHDIKRYHGPDLLFDLEQEGLLKNAVIIGGDAQNKSLVDNKVVSHWIQLPYSNSISVLSEQASRELNPMINEIRIILVSLGLPKQEMVTGRLADGLKGSSILFLPVGAAIDFRTGVAKRSSTVWRSLGLEWLPRLFREPRMLRRNINSLIGAIFFFFHLAFTAAKR